MLLLGNSTTPVLTRKMVWFGHLPQVLQSLVTCPQVRFTNDQGQRTLDKCAKREGH